MVKKIFHLADIHVRTYKYHEEYRDVFNKTINEIRTLSSKYDYNEVRIVIAGDLVHQKINVSNEQLILTSWFLDELAKIAPLIIIAGNHDLLLNNMDRVDSITPIILCCENKKNIHYYKTSECILDENIVWCVYSVFEDNKRPNIDEFKKKNKDKLTYVGLYHEPIQGATTDIGYEFDEYHTNLSIFDGCDFVLMGDIHKRNEFILNNKIKAVYCGSLVQQNYGETIDKHGFLFWDVESKDYEEYDIETDGGFYLFNIKNISDIESNNEKLMNVNN
jgi:DNA repair exonuclease SbcCD nuclease subunit